MTTPKVNDPPRCSRTFSVAGREVRMSQHQEASLRHFMRATMEVLRAEGIGADRVGWIRAELGDMTDAIDFVAFEWGPAGDDPGDGQGEIGFTED